MRIVDFPVIIVSSGSGVEGVVPYSAVALMGHFMKLEDVQTWIVARRRELTAVMNAMN